jgi:hypothetical protein
MADDKTLRSYRSNDPYSRSAADGRDMPLAGTDPLAELARLIGQNDPFTDTIPRQQTAAPRMQDEPGDWRRHVQKPSFDTRQNYDTRQEPAFEADTRYADADPRYAAADQQAGYADAGYADQGYADQGYAEQPVYADQDNYRTPQQRDHYADPHAIDPHAGYRHDADYPTAADYPDEQPYPAAHHQAAYADTQHADNDDGYDDPPRRRRTSGSSLVTAVVLIGCAMLGTAGAYGYRTYANSPGSTQAPVIIADNSPSKIVPSSDQKSARVQDRAGGQGGERLVSREEQPVALPGTSSVPRVVFPSPIQPAPTVTGSTPPSAANAQASGNGSIDRPKSVRTLTIRPDGGDTSARPAVDAAPPPARSAPPQTRAARDQPLSLDPSAPAQAEPPARSQQRAPTPPAPRETAAPARERVAALPPANTNANGNSTGGSYLVQVSSQKSESDAQSSYRALQTKYSQLKSRQAVIRRADLGAKGVYYRAMVPFDSGDEAVQFCNGLKQSGGQCIILRN